MLLYVLCSPQRCMNHVLCIAYTSLQKMYDTAILIVDKDINDTPI
jgi:hypothetical protein